jgi:hypothetical protein
MDPKGVLFVLTALGAAVAVGSFTVGALAAAALAWWIYP